jgi:hypothetical protein
MKTTHTPETLPHKKLTCAQLLDGLRQRPCTVARLVWSTKKCSYNTADFANAEDARAFITSQGIQGNLYGFDGEKWTADAIPS